jgi:hypothetical protein
MIANVIDYRTNKYCVDADVIFEPSCHDNSCKGATQFPHAYRKAGYFTYYEMYDTTVENACEWANQQQIPVTIYLSDKGSRPGDSKQTPDDDGPII